MRTTVDIPDHLLSEASNWPLNGICRSPRLFEDSLRLYLGEQRLQRAQDAPAPLPLLRDPAPVAGIDLDDTSLLWDLK